MSKAVPAAPWRLDLTIYGVGPPSREGKPGVTRGHLSAREKDIVIFFGEALPARKSGSFLLGLRKELGLMKKKKQLLVK